MIVVAHVAASVLLPLWQVTRKPAHYEQILTDAVINTPPPKQDLVLKVEDKKEALKKHK